MMYFHRYIRLTPVVAVVVLYIMSLYKYSGAGPMWMKLGTQDKRCEKSWWATLIYVQNYAFPYKIVSLLRRWQGIPSKTFNYPLVYLFFLVHQSVVVFGRRHTVVCHITTFPYSLVEVGQEGCWTNCRLWRSLHGLHFCHIHAQQIHSVPCR